LLTQHLLAGDSESAEVMQDLVETVTVFRDSRKLGGVEVEIVGRLTALLGEKAYPNGVRGVWGKMVAEERIRRNHPFLSIEV
jgi:site-specific DNA recombinase